MKPEIFGEFLKAHRVNKKLTVRELEDLSGVSHSYLTQLENGKRGIPSPEILMKLSAPLQLSYEELMVRAGYIKYEYSYQLPLFEGYFTSTENLQALFVFGKNLKNLRLKRELSKEHVANSLAIQLKSYLAIEDGRLLLTVDTLQKVASFFDKDYMDMMYNIFNLTSEQIATFIEISKTIEVRNKMKENSKNFISDILKATKVSVDISTNKILEEIYNETIVQIPIYGEIKAGYDFVAEQNIIGYKVASKTEVSDGDYFYLVVKGDSMIDDGIYEGYHVLVKRQKTVQNGKIGVVIVNGDEATLKRVYYDGDNIILQAANKNIPPRVLPINEVMIQGQVKSVVFDV